MSSQQVIIVQQPKSMLVAILLALFFGPLGLLYATITGGLIMIVVSLITGIVTLGMGLTITWPVCVIWAAIAVSTSNQKAINQVIINNQNEH